MSLFESSQLYALFRRNLFGTICSIISFLLIVGLWILHIDIKTREIENRELTAEGSTMDSTLVTGPLIRQELARAQDIVQRFESNLVIEKNLADNLWYFYKIHPDSKDILANLRALNPDGASDDSDYKLIPFSLELRGSYAQVASYLLQIETGPRLAVVNTWNFRRQRQGEPALVLNLEIRVLGRK